MSSMKDAMTTAGFRPKHPDRRDHGRGGREGPSSKDLPKFPDSYFGVDDRGSRYLLSDFVSRKNVDPLAKQLASMNLTRTQVRRFFNQCRRIERRLNVDDKSWAEVSATFVLLSAHAQNAKEAHKIPVEFLRFIDDNVNRVISAEDPRRAFLDGFLPHFEALVGFGAAHLKRDS